MNFQNQHSNYDSLQLLRGLAAILVVFHHFYRLVLKQYDLNFPYLDLLEFGELGVDLFFVLSGFIIFYIHSSDIGKGLNNSVKTFFIKRAIRIYPAYWIVTFGYLPLYFIGGEGHISLSHLINSLVLIPEKAQPILGVAWTLKHEIFFYLIFGLLIMSRKFLYLFAGWIILIFASLLFPTENPFLDLIFNPINLEFLFGCLIAFLIKKNNWNFSWFIGLGMLIFLTSALLKYSGVIDFHRVLTWGVPSFLLILGLVSFETRRKISIPKIFIYLGDASYSIYLTHIVGIAIVSGLAKRLNIYDNEHTLLVSCLAVSVILIFGCLFYSLIEKPLLKYLKNKFLVRSKNNSSYIKEREQGA